VIGTGGIFRTYGVEVAEEIIAGGLFDPSNGSLTPEAPRCFVDRDYIMYAVGLLAQLAPNAALKLAQNSIG
jgi:hypothetical protein